jgi:nicotinate phosphoribosyltransferase
MTLFDHRRLSNDLLQLDIDGLRRGDYADKYFENVARVLEAAHRERYTFAGQSPRALPLDPASVEIGDLRVEVQVFNRRAPFALVAGVDAALAMVRHATGFFEGDQFVETWRDLEVEAVEDGVLTEYAGDPQQVQPVLKIRGRYRDFALLETTILGVLTRATMIATNVYNVLKAANGKPVLFFPARFDLPSAQAVDGYAYWLAVQRYNYETGRKMAAAISTDAQGRWWGGRGGGTIPHALIAAFLADSAEAMVAFARYRPVDIPRILLADFNNDSAGDTLRTMAVFWEQYREAHEAGDIETQRRWILHGVRLDTSGNMRDVSLAPADPTGVNPVLVRKVRAALDSAWESWAVPSHLLDEAQRYCRDVRIVVTGGFNAEKIARFEAEHVPVDVYGVGSTFLRNTSETNTDYTMDVVRVWLADQWVEMAKIGRGACANPNLQPVDLSVF